jgi:hypothetical protein
MEGGWGAHQRRGEMVTHGKDYSAWLVNWMCLAILFGGLVLLTQMVKEVRSDIIQVQKTATSERALTTARLATTPAMVMIEVQDIKRMISYNNEAAQVFMKNYKTCPDTYMWGATTLEMGR